MKNVQLNDNAVRVLERRYLARDEHGELTETPRGMFERVARTIAQPDLRYDPNADVDATAEEFFDAMAGLEFMPNSPTLMNAGRPLGQLSACFVLPVEDSMEQIFDAVKYAALIHKSGGGTGFAFSRLRPAGAAVRSTGGVASGPISFMKVFNAATEAVKQGGTRRGANMGMLRVDHPDIMDFITCKQDLSEITNFNISVALTEEFMRAVEEGRSYDLIDPHDGSVTRSQDAREVFDKIVEMAWQSGEPGIVFIDRMNRDNPVPALGSIESTNPCGEQPLLPYESCNLGSINLSLMVRAGEDGRMEVDYERLGRVVDTAVHFLDNVIEANVYPLEQIRDMTLKSRKIGLGVMGWADMLFELGISYASDEGVKLADEVMGFIHDRAWAASRALAAVRGPFPAWEQSVFAHDAQPPRNATVTTIAPTGTISIFAGASSGVEPLFALAFVRNVMDNDSLPEANRIFERELRERGLYTPALMRAVAEHGTVQGMGQLPEDLRRVFVTAHDISPEAHVRMQAAFQRHTDNAVSKTVNFTHDATRDDVRETYLLAWKLGLKGITIYRDGSRDGQVLNVGKKAQPAPAAPAAPVASAVQPAPAPRPRPDVTMGMTEKVRIGCGNLYVTVNYDEQGICEVFTNLGRAGGCPSQSEATSRLVSTALRAGISPETLIEQLRGIRCHSTLRQKGLKVLSCPDAIGQVLEKALRMRGSIAAPAGSAPAACASGSCAACALACARPEGEPAPQGDALCPECGSSMEHEGGCVICRKCGYSRCS